MASVCINSVLLPSSSASSYTRNKVELHSSSVVNNGSVIGSLKPIVVTGNPPTFVSAPNRRIVAVGDLHGDLGKARSALEMAGVLSSDGQDLWTGGETVLVQLGDILDRGEDEIAILSLFRSLDMQAKDKGGAVFQVNGNHETMNLEGDYRFVASGGFDECADFLDYLDDYRDNWEEGFLEWIHVSGIRKEGRKMSRSYWDSWNLVKFTVSHYASPGVSVFCTEVLWNHVLPKKTNDKLDEKQKGVIARSVLLRPGGPLACEFARHPVALKVNDWIFCHGGLLPHHVAYGVEKMNWEVSQWMKGLFDVDRLPFIATRGYDSVVWNRLYSRDNPDLENYQLEQIQSILEETLYKMDAKAMVVGHTPQVPGANCKYNCSIWRIDVGMSSGVYNSMPEVLEIVDNKARVIRSRRDTIGELQVAEYI